jgi:hypothetical protein
VADPAALLRAGRIAEADAAAAARLAANAGDPDALRISATVALWRNRSEEAARLLQRGRTLRPRDVRLAALHAEACRRLGRCREAADAFARTGRPARARQLASFGDTEPLQAEGATARLRLRQVDPLPLLDVVVQGRPVLALLDTGAADVIVDRALAAQLGLPDYGHEGGAFTGGGGRLGQSRLAALRLGDVLVRGLPASLLDVRRLLPPLDGQPLELIVGTDLLCRFGCVIDYAAAALVLGPPDAAAPQPGTRLPFWLMGDHLIVTHGRLNADRPRLFAVDTGVGGAAFAGPDAVLKAAGVPVPRRPLLGRGGPRPCPVDRLSLGPAERRGLQAFAGVFPTALPEALGVALDGLVGHDFLRGFRVGLDFTRMELTLAPPAGC